MWCLSPHFTPRLSLAIGVSCLGQQFAALTQSLMEEGLSLSEGCSLIIPVKLRITNVTGDSRSHYLHFFNLSMFKIKMMSLHWQHCHQCWQTGSSSMSKYLYKRDQKYFGSSVSFACAVFRWKLAFFSPQPADKHAGSFTHVTGGTDDNGLLSYTLSQAGFLLIIFFRKVCLSLFPEKLMFHILR